MRVLRIRIVTFYWTASKGGRTTFSFVFESLIEQLAHDYMSRATSLS